MIAKTIRISIIAFVLLFSFVACKPQAGQKANPTNTNPQSEVLTHPDWSKDAVIYEVNIRQYSPEGTLAAFKEHLPRLKELGVDILWMMPIYPIGVKNRKGILGSYYSVKNYKEVNPEFGTMEDFQLFVNQAHQMGFKVILDWVANHTAWDNPWITEHPEWYSHDEQGNIISPFDWTDVADLNYDEVPMQNAMIDAMKFWVSNADVDGFRCDVAGMVPTEFWNRARKELDQIKPVFMLAEAEEPALHERAFDMTYAWELHHLFNQMAKGENNADDLNNYVNTNRQKFGTYAYRMAFLTNHDENSWNGTIEERLGDAAFMYAVLSYTLPGMPLIYSGQEVGLNKRLAFFDKDEITWNYAAPEMELYTQLNALKKNNVALWNGDFGGTYTRVNTSAGNQVVAFVREKDGNKVLVFANITQQAQILSVVDENVSGEYTNYFDGGSTSISTSELINLEPLEYGIYIANNK